MPIVTPDLGLLPVETLLEKTNAGHSVFGYTPEFTLKRKVSGWKVNTLKAKGFLYIDGTFKGASKTPRAPSK